MTFVKNEIRDLLSGNPLNFVKKITESLDVYFEYYSFMRFNFLHDLFASFENYSFFYLNGIPGSGKSSLKTLINNGMEENVKIFAFNCNSITELDDIFFAFYKFIFKYPLKHDIFKSQKTSFRPVSLDEQIIYYFKHLSGNILLEFDNIEKMLDENGDFKAENVKSFFEFLSTLNSVKILFLSAKRLKNPLEVATDMIFEAKINGLTETQIRECFKIFKFDVSATLASEIYKLTNGCIYPINLLMTASKTLELPASALVKEAALSGKSFDLFLARKLISKLPKDAKKALIYMAFFRHEIGVNILKSIDHFDNIQQDIELLKTYLLIEGDTNFELRDFLREFLYESIPVKEKLRLHEKIADFYANQIPMKPGERIIEISRTSMYSEKFYHYNVFTKLSQKTGSKYTKYQNTGQKPNNKPDPEKIQYIASTKYFPDFDLKKISDDEFNNTKTDELEVLLSDEEKELLKEEENNNSNFEEVIIDEDNKNKVNNINYNFISDELFDNPEDIEPDDNDDLTKAEELLQKGIELAKGENYKDATGYIQNAMGLFQNKDDEKFYTAKLALARMMIDNFRYDDAREQLLELLHFDLNENFRIDVMFEMASIYEYENDADAALGQYNEMLAYVNEKQIYSNRAKIYFHIALIYDDKHNAERALYHYLLAAADATDYKDNAILASVYSNIAIIYEENNATEKALEYYKKSMQADKLTNNYEGQAATLSSIGNILLHTKKTKLALTVLIRATDFAKKTNDNYIIASSYLDLGDAFLSVKNYKNALKAYFLSKKNIDSTISTDSKNKIERRFDMIVNEIGESAYNFLLSEIKKK